MSNLFNILENASNNNISNNDIIYEGVEKCYFESCLQFISEIQKEHRSNILKLYKDINESSNSMPKIREAYASYNENAKSTIDSIIRKIESDTRNFLSCYKSKYKSDSDILKNLDINNISVDTAVEIYDFCNLEKRIPNYNIIENMYISDLKRVTEYINSGADIKDINGVIQDFYRSISSEFYDVYRAKLIGSKDNIYTENFESVCFNVFRRDKKIENLNKSLLKKLFDNAKSSKKVVDYLQTDVKEARKVFQNIKSDINYYSVSSCDNNDISALYSDYIVKKHDQLFKMAYLFLVVFAAKLDAMADYYMQSSNILVCIAKGLPVGGEKDDE